MTEHPQIRALRTLRVIGEQLHGVGSSKEARGSAQQEKKSTRCLCAERQQESSRAEGRRAAAKDADERAGSKINGQESAHARLLMLLSLQLRAAFLSRFK